MKFKYKGQEVRFLPPIKRYMNRIEWHLHLPFKVKAQVMLDLVSGVCARHEAGESYEAIMADMGTPKQVADSLNAEMADFAYRKSPWRFAGLALSAIGLGLLYRLHLLETGIVSVISEADGPTAVFVTSVVTSDAVSAWTDKIIPVLLIVGGLVVFYLLGHLKPRSKDKTDED